ncbi:hypothetical protein J6590_033204 [Homalodisca vitripennis]|nr:hypothetical protein J6590_033204 [Homalodisca vitripennis]
MSSAGSSRSFYTRFHVQRAVSHRLSGPRSMRCGQVLYNAVSPSHVTVEMVKIGLLGGLTARDELIIGTVGQLGRGRGQVLERGREHTQSVH